MLLVVSLSQKKLHQVNDELLGSRSCFRHGSRLSKNAKSEKDSLVSWRLSTRLLKKTSCTVAVTYVCSNHNHVCNA